LIRTFKREQSFQRGWRSDVFWLAGICLLVTGGCSGRPGRVVPPEIDPVAAADQALADFDLNKDDHLDQEELKACPGLQAATRSADTNQDGQLSAEEIAARIRSWSDGKVALVAVNCTVIKNGRPLVGATVRLVPEKFLGPNILTATGISDSAGRVELALAGVPVKGVAHCGFFRVEISKKQGDQELISEKYNRNTVLGEELTEGGERRKMGIVFDVSGK